MADTQRSKSALATVLADNTAGAISPQDLRDLMESVHLSYGGVYLNGAAAATTISSSGTFYATNWNSNGAQTSTPNRFTVSTGGRLTYTGTPDVHLHLACTISYSVAVASSKELEFRIAKNGTSRAQGSVVVDTNGNTTTNSTALHDDIMMSTNDYVELYVTNNTDTSAVTLEKCYLFAMGMFM